MTALLKRFSNFISKRQTKYTVTAQSDSSDRKKIVLSIVLEARHGYKTAMELIAQEHNMSFFANRNENEFYFTTKDMVRKKYHFKRSDIEQEAL